jgi:hypothetical protein
MGKKIAWVHPVYVDGPLRGGSARVKEAELKNGMAYKNPAHGKRAVTWRYHFHPVKFGPYILTIGSTWPTSQIDKIDMNAAYDLILSDMAKAAISGTRD